MTGLPPINERIKNLMNQKTGLTKRNVSLFSQMISEGREKVIVQQRLDKIFNEENPSTVATDIIEAILLCFPDVDAYWLITGKEKSGSTQEPDQDLPTLIKKQIDELRINFDTYVGSLQAPTSESRERKKVFEKLTGGKPQKAGKR